MRAALLLGLVSVLALSVVAFAQQPASKPQEQTVAPSTSAATTAPAGGSQNGALDVCQELVAFLQQQQAQAAGGSRAAATAPQREPAPSSSTAAAQAERNDSKPVPGQTAPNVDKPQHESGQTGPIPPPQQASKPPIVSLDTAQQLAARGDERGCRDAAQKMRRAGMTMPDTLIALAALRPELLASPQPNSR